MSFLGFLIPIPFHLNNQFYQYKREKKMAGGKNTTKVDEAYGKICNTVYFAFISFSEGSFRGFPLLNQGLNT